MDNQIKYIKIGALWEDQENEEDLKGNIELEKGIKLYIYARNKKDRNEEKKQPKFEIYVGSKNLYFIKKNVSNAMSIEEGKNTLRGK